MFRRSIVALALIASACLVPTLGHAADWPQFRGPGGQGVSDEKGLPTEWSDSKNIVWKTKLPGAGSSSPITLGDRLYVTCYSGYGRGLDESGDIGDLRLHVMCLTAKDGKIVWNTPIEPAPGEKTRIRDHGYAAPTPATDGKHLFVFFGKSGVFKFDLDGKKIWQTSVGNGTHGWGCGTSPVLFDNLVIVNASVESGSLVAIDKESGKEAWRAGGMRASWNTPHLVAVKGGKHELVVSVRGLILGYNPKTGEKLWSCDGVPDYVCPSVVSNDGIVYVIGGRSSRAIAVKAGGSGDVTATHKVWEARVGANVSSPIVHDGHLYWTSDRNQTSYCLKLSDGSVVYEERIRIQPYASTLYADGKLYVVTRWNGTLVLAAKPKFEKLALNKLSDRAQFNASPIASGGKLYLRSDSHLYCIGK